MGLFIGVSSGTLAALGAIGVQSFGGGFIKVELEEKLNFQTANPVVSLEINFLIKI